MTESNNTFWKIWFKFVILLIVILLIWILTLVIGDYFFPEIMQKFKFIHYFILLAIIFKVRNEFLKKIHENNNKE
ncbi:MAG: hypothetical protein Q7K48_01590 [Fusobacterium sp. JB021]|nr:hypothetical protein [Fusobacterium sp. JB020]MDP0492997.1 hypothetical protein [Fusobacterium sp. JB021]MDP0507150.1 hypothetical protein [Fusobacterium sp. JB019]